MPPQHVEIAETVAALRRKLRRENEASAGDTTQIATNRGNKLKPGARYVHSGSLPYKYGSGGYKEKINHAGYQRYILERNPKRFNEYGDELEDSESDPEADADAEEENPYGEVRLEEILRPLTHPSELANHPTMSYAYLDTALPDMVTATDTKIREERNNLWRAKNLYRHFTGDETWIPCERVEAPDDWDLFEPHARLPNGESPSKRRKLDLDALNLENGVDVQDHMIMDVPAQVLEEEQIAVEDAVNAAVMEAQKDMQQERIDKASQGASADVTMAEEETPKTNGVHKEDESSKKEEAKNDTGQALENSPIEAKAEDDQQALHSPLADGNDAQDHHHLDNSNNNEDAETTASTPPPPPRRMTRALAAEAINPQSQTVSPPPSSPTLSSLSPSAQEAHPMFLIPSSLSALHAPHPNHAPLTFGLSHSGLPPEELLETRKLLSLYIQKSEETIRGLEGILGKLIKAKRRRDKVWEWCVAEGHVGEMSDGEDWIDHEAWGLQKDELRKGRDEDGGAAVAALEAANAGHVDEAGAEVSGVVMGGRKGKRRRGGARE